MCLVIDANCFHLVFDPKGAAAFAPVRKWIEGRGRMIYGGTKYNKELAADARVLNLVNELSKAGKTVHIPDDRVNVAATALKEKYPEPEFDDEHIAALVATSKCVVVCTKDKTAMRYLKRPDLFSDFDGVQRPRIFNGHKNHTKLCCDMNIVGACR